VKRCGLYIRVSTDRQAKVQEGSLKNQDQLLTQHVEIRSKLGQEPWTIVDRYVDEGRSAKDTNRPAYQRMVEDVLRGRINTVMCVALSRISRSTRDLLDMVAFFKKHGVEFVCLKEDFDTTTAQGKCFVTIMGALNEFEREQAGERTRTAILARAERGLWSGGNLFGYELDKEHGGYLKVNEREAQIVNFAFQAYLKTGSVLRTVDALREAGYFTRDYVSRQGTKHPPKPFSHGKVYYLLQNPAYVGKKEINKYNRHRVQEKVPEEQRYRVVDAVWPAIVPEKTFNEAQRLLKENAETHNNHASPTKHFYLLNGGFLFCHKCGAQMEGRNGHGHKGRKVYYYYYCKNRNCRFKLPQDQIEKVCHSLMGSVATSDRVLPKVVDKLNKKIRSSMPTLMTERNRFEGDLRRINGEAQTILQRADSLASGKVFAQERLEQLAEQRRHIESRLAKTRQELIEVENCQVDENRVRKMLTETQSIFGEDLQPYKRKQLLRSALQRVELSDQTCQAGIKLSPAVLGSSPWNEPDAFAAPSPAVP